jgi:uncharacterized protein (DUF2236 family)
MTAPSGPSVRGRVEPVPFGPGSLLWELAGDRRSVLVFAMPTLMQAMHPVIGDALQRMPVTLTDPWGRLTRSLDSIHLWVYGGDQAVAEGRRLIELHQPVKGRDIDGRGRSALSPEVWAWVVLSSYPAFLAQCRLFGDPLPPAGEETLYAEIKNLARILGVSERVIPATTGEFWAYYHAMVSTRLVDHPYVHAILDAIPVAQLPPGLPPALSPLWRAAWPPAGRLLRWTVHGTFPPDVRAILRISWTRRDEHLFRLFGHAVRAVATAMPPTLRYPATPRIARRLARAEAAQRPTAQLRRRLERRLAVIDSRNTKSLI